MIIQMNATVCADMDHGEDRRHKIAGSDQGEWRRQERKRDNDQGRRENKEALQKRWFFRDDGPTVLRRSAGLPCPLL
jgi:hypothetical protein